MTNLLFRLAHHLNQVAQNVSQYLGGLNHLADQETIYVRHVDGPVGVHSRNFSNERIYSTGWQATYSLRDGIAESYRWIESEVKKSRT